MNLMNKENYTKIPNEIIEVLAKTKLSNYEMRYIWFLLRKTYGWNKKSDYISNSQFVRGTGIKKYYIWRTEKRLLWRRIVIKRGNKVALNIGYEQWRELPKWATVTRTGIRVINPGKKVTRIAGHKEYLPKETKQKKESSSFKKKLKPYFRGEEMRRDQRGKWWVIPKEGGSWLEFAGEESEIEWQ